MPTESSFYSEYKDTLSDNGFTNIKMSRLTSLTGSQVNSVNSKISKSGESINLENFNTNTQLKPKIPPINLAVVDWQWKSHIIRLSKVYQKSIDACKIFSTRLISNYLLRAVIGLSLRATFILNIIRRTAAAPTLLVKFSATTSCRPITL